MVTRWGQFTAIAAISLSAGGCIPQYVIPEPLYRQIDQTVSFSRLKQGAEQFRGATVALGGLVLGARNLEAGTQIEVLQLPLGDYDQPDGPLESSGGRFLVIDPERRDPAVLQNRLVTIVGQVIGTKVQKVEEFDYAYPYLSALFVHLWGSANEYGSGAANPYYYQYYPSYPYYPYPYLDLFPFWYGPAGYYGAPHGGPWYAPGPRSFGAPPGGMPPPAYSPAPAPGPGPGPGGGPRRFN